MRMYTVQRMSTNIYHYQSAVPNQYHPLLTPHKSIEEEVFIIIIIIAMICDPAAAVHPCVLCLLDDSDHRRLVLVST
jgi:hypothetical protein